MRFAKIALYGLPFRRNRMFRHFENRSRQKYELKGITLHLAINEHEMKKLYYLSTCSTCQRIIKALDLPAEVEMHDIKINPISATELDHMKTLAGSYEALFSRKALKYRALGLHEQTLSEMDYRKWISEEYTFLKRPVLVWKKEIFVGNQNSVVEAARRAVHGE